MKGKKYRIDKATGKLVEVRPGSRKIDKFYEYRNSD